MACILNIETSTDICSVALTDNMSVVWSEETSGRAKCAEQLPRFVEAALYHAGREGLKLDAVAVSSGPGSYTGLRIGVSTAKGVCFGSDVPLIAVPTLDIMCTPVLLRHDIEDDALLCPMLDARRMEVYARICDKAMREWRATAAETVDGETYKSFLDRQIVYFFGPGAGKCKPVITHPNARFIDDIAPLAADMLALAVRKYNAGDYADTAYFTPFYLKEFRAGTPRPLL
ncbi:MAG: tRNA (adenosine(37)-N6)-threonylcarbamoyltransferase complex dimerization subunit type 1 TsaB [Prevotella sp.]|nr:tRNA (adenosine(37)-N6)-threonylcarbamoyltransferase complex dimerization subunit type 1 TsaB [Prevotella sp.]